MNAVLGRTAKRVVLETIGWLLVVVGLAALILPGPGLLALMAGLLVLAQQYEWAERRLDPVKRRALREAARGVSGPVPIAATLIGVAVLVACGVLWVLAPPPPSWWSLPPSWWLPGGIWTAVTQFGSAVIALALMVYSYRRFHGRPEALAALDADITPDVAPTDYDDAGAQRPSHSPPPG